MPWLIVISERVALRWVLDHRRMAFRRNVTTDALRKGDTFALYVTRGAFHNPVADRSQIAAYGRIASPVVDEPATVGEETYERSCRLRCDRTLPPRRGLLFPPLVESMTFIRKKTNWSSYLRRTLVPLSEDDFATIRTEFDRATERAAASGRTH